MIIGYDIDGVGYNFGDSVNRTLQHAGMGHVWKSGPNPEPYWDFYKDWGWTTEQFLELCDYGVNEGIIFQGPARPNFFESMRTARELGHEVVVITDRKFGDPGRSEEATRAWFKWHRFFPDVLKFSADKTCVRTDMFIEDKLENYDALDAAGVEVYLVNRPWNFLDDGCTRRRIDDVSDYTAIIAAKSVSSARVI